MKKLTVIEEINSERYIEEKIRQLILAYTRAQKSLQSKLLNIDISNFEGFRAKMLLNQIDAEILFLNKQARDLSKSIVPLAYNRGINFTGNLLISQNITDNINFGAQIHKSAVEIVINQMSLDLITANEGIKQISNRFIRVTQQKLIQDSLINQQIAEGLISGEARLTTSNRLLKEFRKQIGNEQFITINGRHFEPKYYAELVARTRTREAVTQGQINVCLQYNNDLVQIDVHSGACPDCSFRQGKVYSISGNNPDFPQLDEEPPYHPNCKCNLIPVVAEILKSRGQYDILSLFSKDTKISVGNIYEYNKILKTYK